MSDREVIIPKYANAGVAFAGVELQDCILLAVGVVLGILFGGVFQWGFQAYVGFPVAAYVVTNAYLKWKADSQPGQLRASLYRWGVRGYSAGFPRADTLYFGDANALNPAIVRVIDEWHERGALYRQGMPFAWADQPASNEVSDSNVIADCRITEGHESSSGLSPRGPVGVR